MSRFGSTGTFIYAPGDTLTSGTEIGLDSQDMPNYPVETFVETDRESFRTLSGKYFAYQNWQKIGYEFSWSLISETKRNELKAMYDANPIFSFKSGGTNFGTFRFEENTWEDEEVQFELYDITIRMVED